jgi:hypothetical protein
VAWLAYLREMDINQISTLFQKLSQFSPAYALLAEATIFMADFVLVFLILSVLSEVFETKD